MKRILSILLLSFAACTQAPPIMQITYSLNLPGEVGVSSNVYFSDFASSLSGTITTLTFTNADGDVLEFHISGLSVNTFNMTGSNSMTGSFAVADSSGALQPVVINNTEIGFININGISGSGSAITGLSGDFQINIETPAADGAALGGTGSMTGYISFSF